MDTDLKEACDYVSDKDAKLDDILKIIIGCIKRCEKTTVAVKVVFAQCYGHLFTQPAGANNLSIEALTTEISPTTMSGRRGHYQLNSYASGDHIESVMRFDVHVESREYAIQYETYMTLWNTIKMKTVGAFRYIRSFIY